jgi:bifunctional DNA-binding transcriptional regulator/antitoxin component of YhaV-PrlF toxin-antitoxin module
MEVLVVILLIQNRETKTKTLSNYRVTILEEVCRRFSLKEGNELELTIEGNKLIYKIKGF